MAAVSGDLFVRVKSATNLPKVDTFGSIDAIAKLYINDKFLGESSKQTDRNPKWNYEANRLPVNDANKDVLKVAVFDAEKIGAARGVCEALFPLKDLANSIPRTEQTGQRPVPLKMFQTASNEKPVAQPANQAATQPTPATLRSGGTADVGPGKLFVRVKRGVNLPAVDSMLAGSDIDAIAKVQLNGKTGGQTKSVSSLNPTWDWEMPEWMSVADVAKDALRVTVWDEEKSGGARGVCEASVPLRNLANGEPVLDFTVDLGKFTPADDEETKQAYKKDAKGYGQIVLDLCFRFTDELTPAWEKPRPPPASATATPAPGNALPAASGAAQQQPAVGGAGAAAGPGTGAYYGDPKKGDLYVRVKGATSLPAVDSGMMGTSKFDAFVKLICGKTLHLTKEAKGKDSLNPVWDEKTMGVPERPFDVQDVGTETLEVQVFDMETFGKSRGVCMVSIPLAQLASPAPNPVLGRAFPMVKFEGNNAYTGKPLPGYGSVVLDLHFVPKGAAFQPWSPAVETTPQPPGQDPHAPGVPLTLVAPGATPDSSKPYLFVKVVSGKDIMNMDSSLFDKKDVSDPYVRVRLRKQVQKTKVIDNELNPAWNELLPPFELSSDLPSGTLKCDVLDKDFLKDDEIGMAEFNCTEMRTPHKVVQLTQPVLDKHSRAVGFLTIQAQFIPRVRPAGESDKAEIPEGEVQGDLTLRIEKALNLKMKTGLFVFSKFCDPYCEVWVSGEKRRRERTEIMDEQDSPVFEDEYQLPLRDPGQTIQLKFYDDNSPMPDTLLGIVEIPISEAGRPGPGGGTKTLTRNLEGGTSGQPGPPSQVVVKMLYVPKFTKQEEITQAAEKMEGPASTAVVVAKQEAAAEEALIGTAPPIDLALFSPGRFVLNLKVLYGQNVPAADFRLVGKNTSDPYVVLKVQGEERRTRTVKDQKGELVTFNDQLDDVVLVEFDQALELELWDDDVAKVDNLLGKARKNVKDFFAQPVSKSVFEVQLEAGRKAPSPAEPTKVVVLVRVIEAQKGAAIKAPRACKKSGAYNGPGMKAGSLFLRPLRARGLRKPSKYRSLDPYVKVSVDGQACEFQDGKAKGADPDWAEAFKAMIDFEVAGDASEVTFEVFDDQALAKDDLVGSAKMSSDDIDVPLVFQGQPAGQLVFRGLWRPLYKDLQPLPAPAPKPPPKAEPAPPPPPPAEPEPPPPPPPKPKVPPSRTMERPIKPAPVVEPEEPAGDLPVAGGGARAVRAVKSSSVVKKPPSPKPAPPPPPPPRPRPEPELEEDAEARWPAPSEAFGSEAGELVDELSLASYSSLTSVATPYPLAGEEQRRSGKLKLSQLRVRRLPASSPSFAAGVGPDYTTYVWTEVAIGDRCRSARVALAPGDRGAAVKFDDSFLFEHLEHKDVLLLTVFRGLKPNRPLPRAQRPEECLGLLRIPLAELAGWNAGVKQETAQWFRLAAPKGKRYAGASPEAFLRLQYIGPPRPRRAEKAAPAPARGRGRGQRVPADRDLRRDGGGHEVAERLVGESQLPLSTLREHQLDDIICTLQQDAEHDGKIRGRVQVRLQYADAPDDPYGSGEGDWGPPLPDPYYAPPAPAPLPAYPAPPLATPSPTRPRPVPLRRPTGGRRRPASATGSPSKGAAAPGRPQSPGATYQYVPPRGAAPRQAPPPSTSPPPCSSRPRLPLPLRHAAVPGLRAGGRAPVPLRTGALPRAVRHGGDDAGAAAGPARGLGRGDGGGPGRGPAAGRTWARRPRRGRGTWRRTRSRRRTGRGGGAGRGPRGRPPEEEVGELRQEIERLKRNLRQQQTAQVPRPGP
eukprot:tig00000144_g9084.t1